MRNLINKIINAFKIYLQGNNTQVCSGEQNISEKFTQWLDDAYVALQANLSVDEQDYLIGINYMRINRSEFNVVDRGRGQFDIQWTKREEQQYEENNLAII